MAICAVFALAFQPSFWIDTTGPLYSWSMLDVDEPTEVRFRGTFAADPAEHPHSWYVEFCPVSAVVIGPTGPTAPLLRITGRSVNEPEPGGESVESVWLGGMDAGIGGDTGSRGSPCIYLNFYDSSLTPPLSDEVIIELAIEGTDRALVEWEIYAGATGTPHLCESAPDTTLTLELLP